MGLSQGTAVLRFGSLEAASRARKRMENEDVCGHRISLSFSPRPRDDASPVHAPQSRPLDSPHSLPHHHHHHTFQNQESVFDLAPPMPSFPFSPLEKPRSPRRPRRASRPCQAVGPVAERPYSPRRGCSGPPGGVPAKPHQVSRLVGAMRCGACPSLPSAALLFKLSRRQFVPLLCSTVCSCLLTLCLSALCNTHVAYDDCGKLCVCVCVGSVLQCASLVCCWIA